MTRDAACEPWSLPELEGLGTVTVADLEAVHGEAWEKGFAEGRSEGARRGYEESVARANAELEPRVAEFASLVAALGDPLDQVDEEVERSLVALAMAVARQLVLRELSVRPEQVVEVVREAMRALPLGARGARVTLHPADLELVREHLDGDAADGNLRLIEDPGMERGGCRVHTDVSLIDASVQARLDTVIAQVMGGERPAGPDESADPGEASA